MKSKFFFLLLPFLFMYACSSNHERKEVQSLDYEAAAPEAPAESSVEEKLSFEPESADIADYISSAAAEDNMPDKRFIRKADLKFRAKDVIKSTYRIEDIVVSKGGFVESSVLQSVNHYTDTRYFTEDSLIQIIHYDLHSKLRVRVPNEKLDSTLKEIAPLVDYLDYRTITATDVSLDLLRNRLAKLRQSKHGERVAAAVDEKNIKADNVLTAEQKLLEAQERADNAQLNNMLLSDQITYSTIDLTIYQEGLYKINKLKARPDLNKLEYKPGFHVKLLQAILSGWDILLGFILFLVEIWSILLILAGILIGLRYYRKRKKAGKE